MPELVDESDQLVAANARLARLNVVAGAVGAVIGAGVLYLTNRPAITLALACVAFSAALVVSLMLPSITPHEEVTRQPRSTRSCTPRPSSPRRGRSR